MEGTKRHEFMFHNERWGLGVFLDLGQWKAFAICLGPFHYQFNWQVK